MRRGRLVRVSWLLLVPAVCLLSASLIVFILLRDDFAHRGQLGKLYSSDVSPELCLQRRADAGGMASDLELAPCRDRGIFLGAEQSFGLNKNGQLLTPDGLCVGNDLRLSPCRDDGNVWVFTQGSGLVHVTSGLCLTRGLGSEVRLEACTDRAQQYWWMRLDGQSQPA